MSIPEQLKLTYEDYLNLPDDGKRHEIIDGEHYMTPAHQTRHQIVLRNIQRILLNFIEENNLGELLFAPTDVVLSDMNIVQPDILFIIKERVSIIRKNFIKGPPDLIIEIISPGTEQVDRLTKMKYYAIFGVGEYWLIDFEARILEQYVLKGQIFERTGAFTDKFSPSLFSDLTIQISEIFKGPGFP